MCMRKGDSLDGNSNEEKKKFLRQYIEAEKSISLIDDHIKELRLKRTSPTNVIDGMPKSKQQSDLSAYAAEIDKCTIELENEKLQSIHIRGDVRRAIQNVRDNAQREVLERRYLLDQGWECIAVQMNYTYRHVTRLHGEALKNFRIPDGTKMS